jgi:hypothetical protein
MFLPKTQITMTRVSMSVSMQCQMILMPLLQAVSVAGFEMERAVIRSLNVAFDEDPLPCMGILPSVRVNAKTSYQLAS